ncbi:DUF3800 domain-containing protein [Tardiphaga sp. 37S4]|uniref:DUF3800 domain-containing protein n=1 Tax=Tardiphaga sp. 37S4 TaxID=1404741 RepID=UPI001E635902|nr:DUF3800 domain-containing protein [Tardiphaga sp. 37S4]UFS74142.1 DUF3800 domain-containing protein [Tardiphaga sp. 37S4]
MIRAYIDDSGLGQHPIYVLGGWFAPVEVWSEFSTAWRVALRKEPQISYFKFSEALSLKGQFLGWSAEQRNAKVLALVNLFEQFPVVGISASAPHAVFQRIFGNAKGAAGNPYAMLFYGIIHRLVSSCIANGISDQVEYVFDIQPGQTKKVLRAWDDFSTLFPKEYGNYFGEARPTFADDKSTPALQAADLHAGWRRQLNSAMLLKKPIPEPIWGNVAANIRNEFWFMWSDVAQDLYYAIFRIRPLTYSFEYGYPPSWAYDGRQ